MQNLYEKLVLLSQVIQNVCDVEDMKSAGRGLTKQQFQLLRIVSSSGVITISDMAQILGISRPAASKAVEKLVSLLLICRTESEIDRRSMNLTLTAVGERVLTNYTGCQSKRLEQIKGAFTPDEIILFQDLIDRFVEKCIELQEDIELVCLQCHSSFEEVCSFHVSDKTCYFQVQGKELKGIKQHK